MTSPATVVSFPSTSLEVRVPPEWLAKIRAANQDSGEAQAQLGRLELDYARQKASLISAAQRKASDLQKTVDDAGSACGFEPDPSWSLDLARGVFKKQGSATTP